MIYLVDDNQNDQRIKEYGFSFVEDDTFNGYLINIQKIRKSDSLEDVSHLTFLRNADCILLHSTTEDVDSEGNFVKGSTTNCTKILETIAEYGEKVPLVLFSNKMDATAIYSYEKNPNFIQEIKKNVFYSRLFDFMEDYQQKGKIELRILAYGKNFHAIEISRYANSLLLSILGKKNDDVYTISDISSIEIFKNFMRLAQVAEDPETILIGIEDFPITIQKFRDHVNLITDSFAKYGRNIYGWIR